MGLLFSLAGSLVASCHKILTQVHEEPVVSFAGYRANASEYLLAGKNGKKSETNDGGRNKS